MVGVPIDIQRSQEEVLQDVERVYAKTRHVPMGAVPDAAAIAAMREAVDAARETLATPPLSTRRP